MRITAIVLIAAVGMAAVALAGCDPKVPAKEWGIDQCLRRVVFQECMKSLPAGPASTRYNDWDEVVDSCESAARSQSIRADQLAIKPECRQ